NAAARGRRRRRGANLRARFLVPARATPAARSDAHPSWPAPAEGAARRGEDTHRGVAGGRPRRRGGDFRRALERRVVRTSRGRLAARSRPGNPGHHVGHRTGREGHPERPAPESKTGPNRPTQSSMRWSRSAGTPFSGGAPCRAQLVEEGGQVLRGAHEGQQGELYLGCAACGELARTRERPREMWAAAVVAHHLEHTAYPEPSRVAARRRPPTSELRDTCRKASGSLSHDGDPSVAAANHAVESARGERSGEPDRDAPGLDGLGLAPDLLEADRLGVEVRRALAPERATRGDRVVEELAATAVVGPYAVELLLLPTAPHAH